MTKITVLIFCVILSGKIVSQTIEYNVLLIPQGYTLNLLNGYGSSALFNDVSNISSVNPATLEYFNKSAAGFSYEFESSINNSWIADIGSDRMNKLVPQSFGFIYPIENMRIGFSMFQKYNRSLFTAPIAVTTMNQPDGTGEYFSPEYKTIIYNYSIVGSYTINNITSNSNLSLGFRFGLDNLNEYEKFSSSILNESINSSDFSFGTLYTIEELNNNYLSIGLFYQSELKFNKITKFDNNYTAVEPDTSGYIYANINPYFNLVADLPSVLRFDFDISTISNIKILGSISNVYWSQIGNNLRNQLELSGSIVFSGSKSFIPSIGFLYTDQNYKQDYFDMTSNLSATFLIAGAVFKFGKVNVNLSLADSHLFSGDWRKETIFKTGVSYSF
jgi:hypothetical protein